MAGELSIENVPEVVVDKSARPFLVVYVVWHPSCSEGPGIADMLYRHFRRDVFTNVAGGAGIDVIRRFAAAPGTTVPIGLSFAEADATAVVILLDKNLVDSTDHRDYAETLAKNAEAFGLSGRVYPVSLNSSASGIGGMLGTDQFIRWNEWEGSPDAKSRRLAAELTYQFCRMLRHSLASLQHPGVLDDELDAFLKPVRVFLSHSKHDRFGILIVEAVSASLRGRLDLATFFDVMNIPPGLPFDKVLLHFVKASAMLVIHTDSYGSRTWCRREILEAKRHGVPIVVVNCISDYEDRGFPYMGNVPVVRLEPTDPPAADRIFTVVSRLLDEALKDFLWKCRIHLARERDPSTIFLVRQPELVSLVGIAAGKPDRARQLIVYPDPPLGVEETTLFESVAPGMTLRSFTEWQAELTA